MVRIHSHIESLLVSRSVWLTASQAGRMQVPLAERYTKPWSRHSWETQCKNNKYYLEFVSVILFSAVWTELMVNSLSFRSSFGKMSYTKQVTKAWCSFPTSYIIPPDICTVEVEAQNGDGNTKSDITSWNLDHIGEWLMTSVSSHRIIILPLPSQNRLGVWGGNGDVLWASKRCLLKKEGEEREGEDRGS